MSRLTRKSAQWLLGAVLAPGTLTWMGLTTGTTIFDVTLIAATLLCSLVAGFLLSFAIVAMPGLKKLDDAQFLRAFQEIDLVIQKRQPLFMTLWTGSVLSLVVAAGMGMSRLDGLGLMLIVGAALIYLLGVQFPTLAVNVPLNNRLQTLRVDTLHTTEHRDARESFEDRWNRWNAFRTAAASLTSLLLIVALLRL
jgi:uncharacterized membrane protein